MNPHYPQVGFQLPQLPHNHGFQQTGLPQVGLPQVKLPQVGLPQVGLPQIGLPQLPPRSLNPNHGFQQVGLPQVVLPPVRLPLQIPQNPYPPMSQIGFQLPIQQNQYPQMPQMPYIPGIMPYMAEGYDEIYDLYKQKEHVTIKEITLLLTQDSYYRKLQQWRLLTSEEIKICSRFRSVGNVFHVPSYHNFINKINMSTISFEINKYFPFINNLLFKFDGHLVACGGGVVRSIFGYASDGVDVDLFFYNLNNYEADNMRINAIEFLINSWKEEDCNANYYVKRNEYTTTLYVVTEDEDIYEYQFIHRIYPDISSIIGGFDLSICMVAYDGKEIYATPLGAWSIQNNYIIIDTKRRSTSFEYRLQKYKGRTGLIFPGISHKLINDFNSKSNMKQNMMDKIEAIAKDYGFEYDENWDDFEYIGDANPEYTSYGLQKKENILPYFKLNQCNICTPSYNRKNIENRLIDKISDYSSLSSHPKYFQDINAQQLRSDNLHSVCSILKLDVKKDVKIQLVDDINNPNVALDDLTITKFCKRVEKIRFLTYSDRDFYRLLKCFGKLTPKVMETLNTDEYYKFRDIVVEKMMTNAEICKEKLTGIKWITQNPGRQWTASINPIIADPREWYGKHYIPVITGIPSEIETLMRLMRLPKTESVWTMVDNDVFNLLLQYVMKSYADDAWEFIL